MSVWTGSRLSSEKLRTKTNSGWNRLFKFNWTDGSSNHGMKSDTCSSRDTSTLPPFECPNAPPSWTLSLVYEVLTSFTDNQGRKNCVLLVYCAAVVLLRSNRPTCEELADKIILDLRNVISYYATLHLVLYNIHLKQKWIFGKFW